MKEEICMDIGPLFKENVATVEDWRTALKNVSSFASPMCF